MIRWGNLVLSPWDPDTVTFLMFNMTGCVIKLQEFKFRLNVNFTTYALIEGMKMTSADWSYIFRCFAKVWFSLAHKYKHKHIHSSQWHIWLSSRHHWAFLNTVINKMADASSAILPLICSHEFWVKVAYDWSMTLCLCLCLCRPRFH